MQPNNPPPPPGGLTGLPPTFPTTADALAAARMPPGDEYEEIREQVRSLMASITSCDVDVLFTSCYIYITVCIKYVVGAPSDYIVH